MIFFQRNLAVWAGLLFLFSCGGQKGAATTPKPTVADSYKAATKAADKDVREHAAVTVFISAKCPHAADTLRALLQIKKEMGDALALHIGYVGAVDADGKVDRSIGEDEIQAAASQICAGMSASEESWLAFLNCLYEGEAWRSLPGGYRTCTEKSGIDSTAVEACIKSGEGEAMLAKAYAATYQSRINASPTVVVDRSLYGGERTAEAFRQYLCYTAGQKETRPSVCDTVPPPPKITATMLYDSRCTSALKCDVEGEIAVLEKLIPGFALDRVNFSTDKGKELYKRIVASAPNSTLLPVILIDSAINAQETLKSLLGEYLIPFENGYMFALGGGFDPMAELCDNKIDDNGDGAVDCADAACAKTRGCRTEQKGRLDLFIMSRCPYAVDLMPHVNRLIEHFDKDRKALDFHLQFIGELDESGLPASMHGQEEVDEDLRMVCVEDLYPTKYKFMEYVSCRSAKFESTNWEDCVSKDMSKAKIKACAEGKKGTELLKASFAAAADLGVQGSPTLVLNNRDDMDARKLDEMVLKFCEKNDAAQCKKAVAETPKEEETPVVGPSHQCGQ
jgi:2-hydroxychromene-2-carboxylate isomerase